jgi:hypothetical protein
MPIDPLTGYITADGTRSQIVEAERNYRLIKEEQQASFDEHQASKRFRGDDSGSGPVAAAPRALSLLLNVLVIGALIYILPRAWPWMTAMLHQGRIIELVTGCLLVFMACMAVIAVVVSIWQFLARTHVIKLVLIAVCLYAAWRFIMPRSIPRPDISPIVVTAPVHTAPHHKH